MFWSAEFGVDHSLQIGNVRRHHTTTGIVPLVDHGLHGWVRDTGLTAADAWALADDRSTWRALRPTAGYAQQWVSEWCLWHWNLADKRQHNSNGIKKTWYCIRRFLQTLSILRPPLLRVSGRALRFNELKYRQLDRASSAAITSSSLPQRKQLSFSLSRGKYTLFLTTIMWQWVRWVSFVVFDARSDHSNREFSRNALNE